MLVGLLFRLGSSASSGRSSGTSITWTTAMREPRSAASRAAATSASSDSAVRTTGTTIVRYSTVSDGPSTITGARTVSVSGACTNRRR